MKKNIFYGAVISYSVIKQFYRNDETFDRFVFQQMMDDGDRENATAPKYKSLFFKPEINEYNHIVYEIIISEEELLKEKDATSVSVGKTDPSPPAHSM